MLSVTTVLNNEKKVDEYTYTYDYICKNPGIYVGKSNDDEFLVIGEDINLYLNIYGDVMAIDESSWKNEKFKLLDTTITLTLENIKG